MKFFFWLSFFRGHCDKSHPLEATTRVRRDGEEEDEESTSEDEDDLISVASTASRSIRWSDNNRPPRRPKSRLMPSFTKKSLEFHTCPSEAVPKLIRGNSKECAIKIILKKSCISEQNVISFHNML